MENYITNAKYTEIILEIIRLIKADTPKEELIQYLSDLISKNR